MWIYPNAVHPICDTLVHIGDPNVNSPHYNIQLCRDSSFKVNTFDGYGNITDQAYTTTTTIQTGSRYYITITYNASTQYINYYVNGQLQVSDWINNPLP